MDMTSRPGQEHSSDDDRTPVKLVGFTLVGAGVLMIWYLVWEVVGAYNDPANQHFILKITEILVEADLTVDDRTLSINEPAAKGLAIGLFALFAGLGISIATIPLKYGVQLLSPDIQNELSKVNLKLMELQNITVGNRGQSMEIDSDS